MPLTTADVIKWFRKIEKKKSKKFIQIDVINFYPSISEELLKMAIEWAKQFIDISLDEEEIILKSKRAILFNEGLPWGKCIASTFDGINVGVGAKMHFISSFFL